MISSLVSGSSSVAKATVSSLVFREPAISSLVSVGEEVSVSILQRHSDRQYLVALRDRQVLADSATPLKVGDELRMRVDQQHPRLVLRVLSEEAAFNDILTENLRLFRANPEGLLSSITKTERLLAQVIVHPQLPSSVRNEIQTILQMIQALRYSDTTLKNGDYLRNYPTNIGLLLESHLKRVLLAERGQGELYDPVSGGLKELLLKLTGTLGTLSMDDALPVELFLSLQQVQSLAEDAVKIIENQQIINVLLQETEHTYLLQIPLLFPGCMKLSDILIREDRRSDGGSRGARSFTAELCLDLDVLGRVLVEVTLRDKRITCICKCEEATVREFLSARLSHLQETLLSAGYRVERLSCVLEKDLEAQVLALKSNCQLYSAQSVNLFA